MIITVGAVLLAVLFGYWQGYLDGRHEAHMKAGR